MEQSSSDTLEHFDTEIDRVSTQLETLRGEYDQANQAVEQLGKQREQQEQVVRESAEEKNARGFSADYATARRTKQSDCATKSRSTTTKLWTIATALLPRFASWRPNSTHCLPNGAICKA